MKFLAKMKEKQMQRKIGGMLCGLLCTGVVLVVPSAWADNYFGDNGKTHMLTGANVSLDSGNYDAVYGGYDDTEVSMSEVFKNNVTITGTAATNIVCGAYSFYGNVRENTVTISGNTLGNVVCGGGTGAADAIKNHIIIKANSEVNGIVYGGKGVTSSKENDVTISDSTINKTVYGGEADGNTENNHVTIDANSTVKESVFGGYSFKGDSKNNEVTINCGSVVTGNVAGGVALKGNSEGNTVSIIKSSTGYVYGGKGGTSSKGNSVEISEGTISNSVYGGYVDNDNNSSAEKNNVTISAGSKVSGSIYGGYANHNANENKVSFSNVAEVGESVLGGYSLKADSKNNEVTIEGVGVVKAYVAGGVALAGISEGNKVNIAHSSVNVNVYGGYSFKGNSLDNTVTIDNSIVNENVYGGYTESDGAISEKIQNNKVIFKNGAKIKGDVYGGYDKLNKANITNNTLEVVGKDNEAKGIQNFDKLNFFITKDLIANDTMLKVTDTALINNAEIKAGVELGTKLKKNDTINLIDAGALKAENITTGTLTDGLINIDKGIKVAIGPDGNKLVGVINGTTPPGGGGTTPPGGGGTTPGAGSLYADADAKSPVETQSAALTMLNLGHDLLTTAGYENAALAVDGEEEGSVNPFITMSANNQKLDTGSHVDLKAWNMNLGFAKKINNNSGKLIIVPVIEYGRGSYDSYLDNGTHGDGDAHFWGAGLMAKQLNDDGLYYEGSLRAGRMSTDYQSAVAGGIKYDSDATYYAAHLGMGKVVQLNDKDTLDYYGKLFYTRQQGDKVTVGTGATYDFDATTSLRTRLGARYTHQLSEKNAFYAGLAWQHEFDGESNAIVATTLGSASAPAPSMKGDTGIMELGWRVNNSDKFELGLGVNGSVGKQKGVGFNLSLNFSF